jgi:hypothetical protein
MCWHSLVRIKVYFIPYLKINVYKELYVMNQVLEGTTTTNSKKVLQKLQKQNFICQQEAS